jgi:flagellar motor switch protein FliN/FliY
MAQTPAAQRARFTPLPDPEPAASRSGIDLLAGLQMNVTVELGRTELTVSDVLGLGPGSVIELDRLAGEPVDIMVNDRLVARGEVVVVDENFGVRVVEVVRRAETEERVS